MDQKQLKKRRRQGGFTLTEILVVVFIIGLLSTVVLVNVFGTTGEARVTKAKADMANLGGALVQYELAMGTLPTERQGLRALLEKPDDLDNEARYPAGGIITKLSDDPWGNPYVYRRPARTPNKQFDLFSYGADGKEGGEELDADISYWD